MRLTLLIILALPYMVIAQLPVNVPESGCEPIGISTNPDSYDNPYDPAGIKKWDWRTSNYTIYLTNQSGTPGVPVTIVSPFFDQSGNPNTLFLADAIDKDFKSEDGWELLYQKFGSENQGTITPYFMLYNKYTGVVRVFVNIINSGSFPYTVGGLQITMEKPNPAPPGLPVGRQTAILNHLGEYTFASDQLQKDAGHFTANYYENSGVNNNYYWLYADFTTLYDACTCGLVGDWYFHAGLLNNLGVDLALNGTLTTMVDANPPNPTQGTSNGFFGELNEYITFGSGIINGISGVVTSANKSFKDGTDLVAAGQALANNSSVIIGNEKAKNLAPILFKIFVQAARINMVLNLASSLITTVKKLGDDYDKLTNDNPKDANALKQPKVTESGLKAIVSGEIKVNSPYVIHSLRIPGSETPNGSGAVDFRHPVYDEILGVWNLFEQPKFEITEYKPRNNIVGEFDTGLPDPSDPYSPLYLDAQNDIFPVFPSIYQINLMNMPKVMVNPASGLEVVNISYQIEFTNYDPLTKYTLRGVMKPGDFNYFTDMQGIFGNFHRADFYTASNHDREIYTQNVGLELVKRNVKWDTSQISTPFLDQSCIQNYPIFSYSKIAKPQLKVKVVLKPINNDPNSDVDEVIFTHTFPGVIETKVFEEEYLIGGTVYRDVTDPLYEPVGTVLPIDIGGYLNDYNGNSILEDDTISTSFTAIGDMHVMTGVVFTPGTHIIGATGDIYINKSLINLPPNTYVTFQSATNIFVSPESVVDPEIVLQIEPGLEMPCTTAPEIYPLTADIVAFCNGSTYDNRSKPNKNNIDLVAEEVQYLPIFKDHLDDIDFVIFPNPTDQLARIELKGGQGTETIRIFDMFGREVDFIYSVSPNGMELDLNHLESGAYQVQILFNTGAVRKQLIITK